MDGVIRYLARDALAESLKQAIAKNDPGMWVRAADFDERQAQGKQREVVLQDRLTDVEQRNDELLGLLRRIGDLRGTLDQHGLLEEVDAAINPATEACKFPQSCTTRCDCDIPDFSPGNGNKARRRALAIEALRQENQWIVPCNPDANEPPCTACFARGCNGECMENL